MITIEQLKPGFWFKLYSTDGGSNYHICKITNKADEYYSDFGGQYHLIYKLEQYDIETKQMQYMALDFLDQSGEIDPQSMDLISDEELTEFLLQL